MAAFQEALTELRNEGITVVAGSVDPLDKAETTAAEQGLTYPVLHSLDLLETAETLTAFYEPRRNILHATGFVVRPDQTIGTACYSTGPIGRLEPTDVLRVVQFWKKKAAGQ